MRKLFTFILLTGLLFLSMGFDNTRNFRGGSEQVAASTNKHIYPDRVPVWQYAFHMAPSGSPDTLTVYTNSDYTDSIMHVYTPGAVASLMTPTFGVRAYRFRVKTPASTTVTVMWE